MSLDPDKIYEATIQAAREWSEADGEARKLREMQRIVLSEIINQTQGDSFAERKAKAQASPEYKLHITNMVAAKTKANILLAKYKATCDLSDNRRSQEVTRRTEANIR